MWFTWTCGTRRAQPGGRIRGDVRGVAAAGARGLAVRVIGGWEALRKLEYVDELMGENMADGREGVVAEASAQVGPMESVRKRTLRKYTRRSEGTLWGRAGRISMTGTCGSCFRTTRSTRGIRRRLAVFREIRRDVRRRVASWTGEYQYTIDQVIENMIRRANELNLRLSGPEESSKGDFTVMLTVQTMNYLHSGFHRVAL